MSGLTATQRSLAHLRKAGYTVGIVEHWNPHMQIRQDLFGFIDLIAVRPGEVLGVQTTSGSNMAAHVTKILAHPNLAAVRDSGMRLEVHGWRKIGKPLRWNVRVLDLSTGAIT